MSCSGYEPFHKKTQLTPTDPGTAVAEFLIFDEQFPRSIRRCLWECESATASAAGNPVGRDPSQPEQRIAALLAYLDARMMPDVIRDGLHETLTHVVDSVHGIGEAIHAAFFAAEIRTPGWQAVPAPSPGGMTQTQSQS
jgi:uncharacterized alpha-E superfamily protein